MKLAHLAQVIRSKNAGPFELTFDILFSDLETFQRVKDSGVITRELVARLYRIPVGQVLHLVFVPAARAIKATIVRPVPSGSVGDTDVYGAQQHAPWLDVEIPLPDGQNEEVDPQNH